MKKLKPSRFLPCPAQLGNWGCHSGLLNAHLTVTLEFQLSNCYKVSAITLTLMKLSKAVFLVPSGIQTYPTVLHTGHILSFEHTEIGFHYTVFIHLE